MPATNSFTFLTWNLCMLENSDEAPANWSVDQTEAAVREFILKLGPDFVFFQELPGLVPYVETHDLVPVNTISHSGNIATIVRKDLMDDLESNSVGRFAVITTIKPAGLTFANVHLLSGANAKHTRLEALNQVKNECPTPALAIVGDTNTRLSEEKSIESIGLMGNRPPSPTWNTKVNRFRRDGRAFSAYFTRYFHNDRAKIDQVKVWCNPWPHDEGHFFLSDHYAMSGRATVVENA